MADAGIKAEPGYRRGGIEPVGQFAPVAASSRYQCHRPRPNLSQRRAPPVEVEWLPPYLARIAERIRELVEAGCHMHKLWEELWARRPDGHPPGAIHARNQGLRQRGRL